MNWLDYRDRRPIYEQIADRYKTLILKGVLEPDEQLPSVRSLAVELSTNPNTVQKAYAELERDGFIYTVRGKGNFIGGGPHLLEEKRHRLAGEIAALLREADELGIERSGLLREADEIAAKDNGLLKEVSETAADRDSSFKKSGGAGHD